MNQLGTRSDATKEKDSHQGFEENQKTGGRRSSTSWSGGAWVLDQSWISINDTANKVWLAAPKKQTRGRGKKKAEPLEDEIEATKENIDPEPVKEPVVVPKQKSPVQQPKFIPTSPSKRVSSISSRIPSPVKKHSLSSKPDLDHRKTEHAITQNFLSKNLPKLNSIIDELKTSKAESLFDDLKASTETRFKTSDDLINSLTNRNQQLAVELEELKNRLAELENHPNTGSNEEESFQNELILDMMEQIVGLRIHKVEETEEALSFDCSQSGKNGGEYNPHEMREIKY